MLAPRVLPARWRPDLVPSSRLWLRLVVFGVFFVSFTCAGLVPTGTWRNVFQGGPTPSGQSSNTAVGTGRPHTFVGTFLWRVGPYAVMCGGESSFARSQCASWNDGSENWAFINTTGFSGPQQRIYGASWVDQATNTIYMFGGHSGTPASCLGSMYRATVNPTSGSISAFTFVSTSASTPGPRAFSAFWQDSARGVFYLFGGSSCGSSLDATHSDLWAFFPSNSSWLLLNSGGSLSSVAASPGVEAATNWPSIRRGSLTAASNDGKYVYLFGGAQQGWEFPFGDLWRFNLATQRWAFMSGLLDQTYGSRYSHDEPAFDPTWLPAATHSGAMWMDRDGYLWLREGFTGSGWVSRDVWIFSPSIMQWGRNKGSQIFKRDSAYASGSRFFQWPGYATGSVFFTRSSDSSMAYVLHGFGWSTTQDGSPQYIWDIWRISTRVDPTPISAAPKMPVAPIGHNPGIRAKWIELTSCAVPPTMPALTSSTGKISTNETGYLLRYEFGNAVKSMAPSQVSRANCFAVQFTGYLWNPTTTLIPFRFLFVADSAVQVEWSTAGNEVMQLASWWNTTATPFAPHPMAPFYSDALLQAPGATWFRVTYYKVGSGSGSLQGGLVDDNFVSNFRMLHSSFVTTNYIATPVSTVVLPVVSWTPIDLRQAFPNGTAPDPQTWPSFTSEGMKWEIWDWVFVCGAAIQEAAKGCSAWKHSAQTFVWTNPLSLTVGVDSTGWKGGLSFADPTNNRLYLVGGARAGSDTHVTGRWWANFNNVTGEISAWTYEISGSPLSFRSFATTWQDDAYNFWCFSGGAYDSNVNDLWVFNVSTQSWSQLSPSTPTNLFNSTWSGTYGTEDAINWPSARTRTAVVRDTVNKNYVYMYGGAGTNRENPTADLWRFNMQNRRWALLAGTTGNAAMSWSSIGEFHPKTAPPALYYPSMQMDKNGQYLWLWGGMMPGEHGTSSVWCFRLSDRLWARALSPFGRNTPSITAGPPYWTMGRISQTWAYNGTFYDFGGHEFSARDQGPNIPISRRVSVWKGVFSVGAVSFPFPVPLPKAPISPEPAPNRAVTASYYYFDGANCPKSELGFASFAASFRRFTENRTSWLTNFDFGTSSSPAPGVARPACLTLESSGYYWNTETTPQLLRFRVTADDGVQFQWRDKSRYVLSHSLDITVSSWADHGFLTFESSAVIAYPGPNWFRLSFYDSGGSGGTFSIVSDGDGVTNPRTFVADSVSLSVTKSVPEASWTRIYNQFLSSGSEATSPAPGVQPHYLQNAQFWQVGATVYACGGGEPTSADCAAWNEEQSRWTWFGIGSFPLRIKGGIAWVDQPRRRLWLYGGQTDSGYSNTLWFANYESETDSIISAWQTINVAGGPGFRAWSAHWQDESGNLWLWSGANVFPSQEANTADIWRFNAGALTWTSISAGPSVPIRSSVIGTPGVEAPAVWPGVRTRPAVARGRGSNIVYIFGGNRGIAGAVEAFGDLWSYNMDTGYWAYLGGENTRPTAGASYTDGFFSNRYQPASSLGGALFVDVEGDLWMFGGAGTPGAHSFLWTYSIQRSAFSRVFGSPNQWETPSSAEWPGAVADFGFMRSAFDPNSLLIIGGSGWNETSRGQSANVWRLRTRYPYSTALPQEPAFSFDSNPAGFNVSFYEFSTPSPAYTVFSTWGTLLSSSIDTTAFPLREDFGRQYAAAAGVDRSKVWGVRYESFFYNPSATAISFRFQVRADDGVYIQWGSSPSQVLQDSGTTTPYSSRGVADFTSTVLTAPSGYTFVRISLLDTGNGSSLIVGMVDSDGSNYRPLHSSNFRRSAPGAVRPIDVAPPTLAPSTFQFQSAVDLAPQDIVTLENRLCEIARNITGRTQIVCTIVALTKRAAGPHLATLTSADATTAQSVATNLNPIRDAFVNSLTTSATPPSGLTGSPSSSAPSSNSVGDGGGGSTGIIAAVIVVALLLIAAAIVGFVLWKRRKAQKKPQKDEPAAASAYVEMAPQPVRTSYSDAAVVSTSDTGKKQPASTKQTKKNKKPTTKVESSSDSESVEMQPMPAAAPEPVFDLSDFKPEWLIPFNEIEIEKKLGAGAFGIVYAGSYNDTEVAIKQTNLNVGQNSLDEFKREAVLLLSIKPHPCVVQVLGISISESNIYMVMEFCENGSLDTFMQSKQLEIEEKEKILDSAASGIAHLHRNGVVHRDIAARNVLVAGGLKAKIADFGMSRIVDKFELKGTTNASVGPIKYMAPESLTKNKVYSSASDCWTFGILCVEVWTGKPPHSELDMLEAAVEIRDKGLHPDIPADMPHWLHDVVSKCFEFKPEDRISMQEISKIFRKQRSKRAESMREKPTKDSLDN